MDMRIGAVVALAAAPMLCGSGPARGLVIEDSRGKTPGIRGTMTAIYMGFTPTDPRAHEAWQRIWTEDRSGLERISVMSSEFEGLVYEFPDDSRVLVTMGSCAGGPVRTFFRDDPPRCNVPCDCSVESGFSECWFVRWYGAETCDDARPVRGGSADSPNGV